MEDIKRNGYVISEVGKPPDLVLEVGSRSTGRRDYTVKRKGYARYGVREYWRFDPSGGDYHDAHLGGDTLVDGEYQSIEIVSESEDRHWDTARYWAGDMVVRGISAAARSCHRRISLRNARGVGGSD